MPTPKGFRHSDDTKRRISQNNAKHWLGTEGARKGQPHTPETKSKISAKLKGRVSSDEWRRKQSAAHTGKTHTLLTRLKQSISQSRRYGLSAPTPKRFRQCHAYRRWREKVLARAAGYCQICKSQPQKLEADHIKPFALFPDLRYDVENGRGLCQPCHLQHGWRGSHIKQS